MAGKFQRDLRGRFVSTANAPESAEGKFATYDELPVEIQGADPADLAYDTVLRHAPDADDLSQGGQQRRLQPRTATLVPDADESRARTRYGIQGILTRLAARRSTDPMDPTRYLTGADDGRS